MFLNLKKIGLITLSRLYTTLIQFLITFILSKYFEQEIVGQYFLFISWIIIFSSFFGLGTPIIVIKESSTKPMFNTVKTKIFFQNIFVFILKFMIPILIFINIFIYIYMSYDEIFTIILIFSLIAGGLLSLQKILIEYLKGKKILLKAITLEFNIIPTLTIIYILVALLCNNNLNMIYFMLFYLLSLFFVVIYIWKKHISIFLDKKINNYNFTFSNIYTYWFITLSLVLILNIPYIIFPSMITLNEIAIFSVVHRIVAISSTLQYLINSYYAPIFSQSHHNNNIDNMKKFLKEARVVSFLFLLPFFIIVFYFNKDILSLFGTNYIEGSEILLIMLFSRFIISLLGPMDLFLNMTNNVKFELFFTIMSIIIFLISIFFLQEYTLFNLVLLYVIMNIIKSLMSFFYVIYLFKYNFRSNE